MQHTQSKIEHRDPKSLRLHKLRKHFPEIDKEGGDWIALTDSVSASGVMTPLLITAEGFIADGGWRWEAAKDWQIKEVPVQIIPEEMVALVIAESLICRKQMTRGATVYLMIPIIGEIILSAEFRRLDNLKSGRKTNEIELKPQCFSKSSNLTSEESRESVKNLCIRWGITKETFYKARTIWQWLNEPDFAALKKLHTDLSLKYPGAAELRQLQEELRLDYEHLLLNGEKNLWNVESGIKGSLTGGAHEPPQKQLELFGDALDSLATRAERFTDPAKAGPEIRKWLRDLETEMCEHRNKSAEEFREKLSHIAATTKVAADTMAARLRELKQVTA